MNGNLTQVFDFVCLLQKFQQIKRAYYATAENRAQNDAEHSFNLAMLCWYVVRLLKLNDLNLSLVLSYALVHDLIELAAGDTDPYNPESVVTKDNREAKARQWLGRELPEFADLHQLLSDYEANQTSEARFVRALDKVIPCIEIILDSGRSWQERGHTLEMVKAIKSPKVTLCPVVNGLYQEILNHLERRKDELFPQGAQMTFGFLNGQKGKPIKPFLVSLEK